MSVAQFDPSALRFLCVCQYGHSRSVALARRLHARHVPAIACGVATAGPWLFPLCDWASHVLLLDDALRGAIPAASVAKVVSFNVGPDRWVNPYHPELADVLEKMIDERLPMLKRSTT